MLQKMRKIAMVLRRWWPGILIVFFFGGFLYNQELMGRITFRIVLFPVIVLVYAVLLLPSIIIHGGVYLFWLVVTCFLSGFLLYRCVPKAAHKMLYYWPVVCFMMGFAYLDFIAEYVAFLPPVMAPEVLCSIIVIPIVLGLLFSKLIQEWEWR